MRLQLWQKPGMRVAQAASCIRTWWSSWVTSLSFRTCSRLCACLFWGVAPGSVLKLLLPGLRKPDMAFGAQVWAPLIPCYTCVHPACTPDLPRGPRHWHILCQMKPESRSPAGCSVSWDTRPAHQEPTFPFSGQDAQGDVMSVPPSWATDWEVHWPAQGSLCPPLALGQKVPAL